MIIVEGWVRLRDAAELERVRPAVAAMMAASRGEAGCLSYAYAQDLADPCMVRVVERWADEAALAEHFATAHMAAFGLTIAGAGIESASIKAYGAEEIRTVMAR